MLFTVAQFRQRVNSDINGLIQDLQDLTGRFGQDEAFAWQESLSKVAQAFDAPALQSLQLYLGNNGNLEVEYRLPAASSWCDMVLLGGRNVGGISTPSAVILELKNWQTRNDTPGSAEGLMQRQGSTALHPSDQVKGYSEYCRHYHSAVEDFQAKVHGCVVFTKDPIFNTYRDIPNADLTAQYPCFSISSGSSLQPLSEFLQERLNEPHQKFAEAFATGVYRQNRSFLIQIAAQMEKPQNQPFELLDNQRLGFTKAKEAVYEALFEKDASGEEVRRQKLKKKVMVIEGPPGSGKSVVAARLWAALIQHPNLGEGNVVITSTSNSQRDNWRYLLQSVSSSSAAKGVIKGANDYVPTTTGEFGRLRKKNPNLFGEINDWRENLKVLKSEQGSFRMPDNAFEVSIVDEAHALINPEFSDARGQYGFPVHFGPQAYHIIRGSVVSIFLMDSKQSFRERETTTRQDIEKWATELDAEVIAHVSLEGSQFRCGGSVEYIDWLEAVFNGKEASVCHDIAKEWLKTPATPSTKVITSSSGLSNPSAEQSKGMTFQICDSPAIMEEQLRAQIETGASARLLASYSRRWLTNKSAAPHALPPSAQDFYLPYTVTTESGTETRYWSRIWNFANLPQGYTAFVQAPPGTKMAADPLCEVGCPYVVRGFDYDYIGLLWLGDVFWNQNNWQADIKQVFESGLTRHTGRAKKELDMDGDEHRAITAKLLQGYRILLSRAVKGVYVYFEDPRTRERFEQCL